MRPVRIALLIAALGAIQAHAGVFDDDEARRQVSDLRIKTEARFDQQAKAQHQARIDGGADDLLAQRFHHLVIAQVLKIGRASCRERVYVLV